MNPEQQRKHTTAVRELEEGMLKFATATETRQAEFEQRLAAVEARQTAADEAMAIAIEALGMGLDKVAADAKARDEENVELVKRFVESSVGVAAEPLRRGWWGHLWFVMTGR